MTLRICLLPGDGIGPEVIDCAEQVLRPLPLDRTSSMLNWIWRLRATWHAVT